MDTPHSAAGPKQTMTEPSLVPPGVSIPQANQATKPSLPLKSSKPRAELGDSGVRMLHGIIVDEYNANLQGLQGIKVYDEMRKSDGTVRAAVLSCTLPIRRAEWFVNPANDTPEAKDQALFVEHALFDWLDITWDDVLRQALLMVSFGVMVFEKVYGTKEHDGKTYVTLEKLAPRLPKSILQWELADRTFGIQQIRQDGVLAQIPGSKLLIFVNEREGDNWWGLSMLRAAYKHWYYKDLFYRIDSVAFERQGLGVPVMKMPKGYTASDEAKAKTVLQNLRANEAAYILMPDTYEFEFADMGGKTTRDPTNSINHHNKEILQSVLAQFLELGANKSGSGSRALSQDHSDLFLKAMEAVAGTIIDEINKNLIPELIDMNFNDVEVYPVLDWGGIAKVDIQAFGTAYAQLVTAGAITATPADQQFIRAIMGLPPRTPEEIQEETDGEPSSERQADHADVVETDPTGDSEEEAGARVDDAAEQAEVAPQTKKDNKQVDKAAKTKKPPAKKPKAAPAAAAEHKPLPLSFDDGNGFMSWRPLVFAEQKVSWKKIQDTMDAMEKDFTVAARKLLNDAKDAFMAKLQPLVEEGDHAAITALELKFVTQYTALLKDAMKKAYEYGKNNVSTEMDISSPPNSAESLARINLLADTVANKTASDLESKAKISVANALKNGTTTIQALGSIDAALEEAIDKSIQHTSGIIIGQNINGGRNDVFQRNLGMIYALQRSEVLDERTCEFCLSMDSLTILPTDSWASTDVFHENCRGIWVEILTSEQDVEDIEITGVPSELADYYGGEPNALVQPKNAIVRDGSPAAAEVQRRKDAKK